MLAENVIALKILSKVYSEGHNYQVLKYISVHSTDGIDGNNMFYVALVSILPMELINYGGIN